MRINLGCGSDVRPGYVNVDRFPNAKLPKDVYRQGDIQSLDWLVEDDKVEEIVAIDCLEYLPVKSRQTSIANWVNKLSKGSTIKILVPDCHAVAKAFHQGQLNLDEFNTLIFGTQEHNDNRLSAVDTSYLILVLEKLGLTITLKRYEGVAIYLEAVK